MNSNNSYNAILVLGTGIGKDGLLPASTEASVKKAVDLFKRKEASQIIFSGRWSYSCNYSPPLTEAKAMAKYAFSLGAKKKDILTEDNSITTVANLCLVKSKILIKNNWNKIILVSIYPQSKRVLYNLKYVLGKDYIYKLVLADFSYSPEKRKELEKIEKEKLQKEAIPFYKNIRSGDHQSIYKLAMADLKSR